MSKEFDNALGALLLTQPFYASLALKFEFLETEEVPTLFVDSRRIGYNPGFMSRLTPDEAMFCVAHEVMHVAWRHLPRLEHFHRTGIGPDGKPYDHQRMNRACDYVGNAMLVSMGVGTPPRPEIIKICLDQRRYPDTLSPEEVYVMLEQDEAGGGGGGGVPQSHDDHRFEDSESSCIKPLDVVQAVQRHKMMVGSLPGTLQRLIDEIRKPDDSPWDVLRRIVSRSTSGRDSSSWNRLHRHMLVRGIGVPGRVAHRAGKVGVVVDVSGSIGQEMLDLFAGHMSSIIDDARPEMVHVIWVDAAVQRIDNVESAGDLLACLRKGVPGGGGTDMTVGVRKAESLGVDSTVVLTDGYTPFCDSDVETIWAITSPRIVSPYGTSLHIGGAE